MWNARQDEAQAGIKTARRNINNLRYANDTTLKSHFMKVKEESEKAGLKLNIHKAFTGIMASNSITSWQRDGETMETVSDFIFLGSKITVDSDCSYEIKMLIPWKKSYDKSTQCIKKQRIYLLTKVYLVKAMLLPVVMYRCER